MCLNMGNRHRFSTNFTAQILKTERIEPNHETFLIRSVIYANCHCRNIGGYV